MFLVGNYSAFTNLPASVLFLGQRHFENGLTKSLSARWVMVGGHHEVRVCLRERDIYIYILADRAHYFTSTHD